MNYLVRKQCHIKKSNVLIFNFNGHRAEFRLKEFCLVNGLKGHKFGRKKVSSLKNAFFAHDEYKTRRDIERTFKGLGNEEKLLKVKLVDL